MARLSGQFVILLLADVPVEQEAELPFELACNEDLRGLNLTVRPASRDFSPAMDGKDWLLEVSGADNPSTLHAMANVLCKHGINITDLATFHEQAPLGGTQLFRMQGRVRIPAHVDPQAVRGELAEISSSFGADLSFVAK